MAEVKAFQGYRFDAGVTGPLDQVITPPYDVISPEQREALVAASPYNMAHALLPQAPEGDPYTHAADVLERWLADGALKQDDAPSYYLLEQRYTGLDGLEHTRRGFFAVVKAPEPGESIILGHERTFEGPVEDRLKLMEATHAQLGPIFVLYDDDAGELAGFLAQMDAREADAAAQTIDGAQVRLWRVDADPAVERFFDGRKLYIADGHHRFKTACHYRDQRRAAEKPDGLRGYDFVLMGFVAFNDPGLVIFPPHRLVDPPGGYSLDVLIRELGPYFMVEPVSGDLEQAVKASSGCRFGLATSDGGRYLLRLKSDDRTTLLGADRSAAWRNLDVAVLHRGILGHVMGIPEETKHTYQPDTEKALAAVEAGEHAMCFLLPQMDPGQVRAVAEAGDPMPQKATYFFPKLPSGAVLHRFE